MPKTRRGKEKTLSLSITLNIVQAFVIAALAFALVYIVLQPPKTIVANTTNSQLHGTLANIGVPLNASELSVINNAPNSYFDAAGQKFLNGTLTDFVAAGKNPQYPPFIVNGKPSVIYMGAISCVYCAENRWAMALALSRFGNFTKLFKGYSALGDGDVPTVYWTTDNFNSIGSPKFGNFYNSNLINFIDVEYDSPINQSIVVQPPSYFIARAPNSTYRSAMTFMNNTNKFGGTPFTFWGKTLMGGADAVVLGNTLPSGSVFPIANWTHAQILNQLSNFDDQFAWGEYAAADVYVAQTCAGLPSANAVSACTLPSITALEKMMNLTH